MVNVTVVPARVSDRAADVVWSVLALRRGERRVRLALSIYASMAARLAPCSSYDFWCSTWEHADFHATFFWSWESRRSYTLAERSERYAVNALSAARARHVVRALERAAPSVCPPALDPAPAAVVRTAPGSDGLPF